MSTSRAPVEAVYSVDIPVGHKSCTVRVLPDNELRLYVANCLRKRSNLKDGFEIQYVSSNVELYWEEHHFIEARYDCTNRTLQVSVNRRTVFETFVA
ncbi:MAG: hypothetical protein F4Z01_02285 [Gammaproteobacteria bacterium]|nr:hypothetical protein [Gammaproteobacteria bacterium]